MARQQQAAPFAPHGPAAAVSPSASQPPLKHLQVVHQAGSLAYSTTEHIVLPIYQRVKSVSPTFVAPGYQRLEGIAGQVVPQATEAAESLLRTADSTVDSLLDGLPVEAAKDLSSRTGLDKLLQSLSAAGDYVVILAKQGSASVSAGVQSARDTLQSAVDTAREATDPDVGLAMAQDAWTKFAAYPPVKAFLERAEPATNLAIQTFLTVHDGLVASPVYKTAVDTTASTLNFAYTTTPYKLGVQYLYPLVQPVADPAIHKVSNSKVFGQVLDYWKPVQPQATAAPAVSAH